MWNHAVRGVQPGEEHLPADPHADRVDGRGFLSGLEDGDHCDSRASPAYYPIMRLGRRLRKVSRSNRERIADISSNLQETFSGIRAIKAFGMEEFEAERFKEMGQRYLKIP
jgi:hypothetical protein